MASASASSSDQEERERDNHTHASRETREVRQDAEEAAGQATARTKMTSCDDKLARQPLPAGEPMTSEKLAEAVKDGKEGQDGSEDEDTDTTYLRAIEAHEQKKKQKAGPDFSEASVASFRPTPAASTPSSVRASPVKVPKLDLSSSDLFAPGRATLAAASNRNLMASGPADNAHDEAMERTQPQRRAGNGPEDPPPR